MWLFLEKLQMFACSNKVCACRKLSTFRYHVLFCCWFLIFDINCGVCWKDTFLFKTVLNILECSTPCSRAGTVSLFGSSWDSVKCLFAWFYVSLSQTLNSAVVSTLNILYEAKVLEIKKNEMKTASYPLSDLGIGSSWSDGLLFEKEVYLLIFSQPALGEKEWGNISLSNKVWKFMQKYFLSPGRCKMLSVFQLLFLKRLK